MKKLLLLATLSVVAGVSIAGSTDAPIPITGTVQSSCEMDMSAATMNAGNVVNLQDINANPITGSVQIRSYCTSGTSFEIYTNNGAVDQPWTSAAGNRIGTWRMFQDAGYSVAVGGQGSGISGNGNGSNGVASTLFIRGTGANATSPLSAETPAAYTNNIAMTIAW